MGLRHLSRYEEDQSYYIDNNYDYGSLLNISADLEKAKVEIKKMEMAIYEQINKVQRIVEYREIIVSREKKWKGNVEVYVYVNKYKMLDGARLERTDSIYGTHKKFAGNEKRIAIQYAAELRKKYPVPIVYINWK